MAEQFKKYGTCLLNSAIFNNPYMLDLTVWAKSNA